MAETPVLRVFASAFGRMRKKRRVASPAVLQLCVYSLCIRRRIANTPARSHTHRAFCRICIFANTSEFSKISADDQNPSAHTYPIFFLMQRRFAVFAINPLQKSNAFLPPCGRNTIPIVLSVFFFEKLLPATADRTPSAVVMRQVCWALLFCTIFGRGNLHENYES